MGETLLVLALWLIHGRFLWREPWTAYRWAWIAALAYLLVRLAAQAAQ